MPIKTGRVRRAFDSAIANKIVCPNMLLMTIAYVCHELDYNNLSENKAAQYTSYRASMCRTALQHDITKDQITAAIYKFDSCRFPSEQQTSRLFDLISGTYRFADNDSVIPDSDLIFLNDTEISNRKNHIPVKQTKQLHTQPLITDFESEQETRDRMMLEYFTNKPITEWTYNNIFYPNILDKQRLNNYISALRLKYNPEVCRDWIMSDEEFAEHCDLFGKDINEVVSEITENGAIPFTDDKVKWFMSELAKEGFQYNKPLQNEIKNNNEMGNCL